MSNIGLQLFTLRDLLAEDFVGTLEKVAKIGYSAAEFFHYGGLQPKELRRVVDDLGITPVSCHVPLDRLEGELDQVIEEAQIIGLQYIACPWLPEERRQSADDYARLAVTLQNVGEKCQEAGIQFAYHNHDFEFAKFNGTYALDTLYAETDPNVVQAELDLYWIHHAGEQPVQYINRYAGRCDLLHVKDADAADGSFAEVGSGVLNWDEIFAAAKQAGTKWYIVEQDVCKGDPLVSIEKSLAFVSKQV